MNTSVTLTEQLKIFEKLNTDPILIRIVPVKFGKLGEEGDFYWMILDVINNGRRSKYYGWFFIINDNIEKHKTSTPQGGNSIARQFNSYQSDKLKPVFSAGIPTGTNLPNDVEQLKTMYNGFKILSPNIKKIINDSFDEVSALLMTGNYHTICYSCNPDFPLLIGTGIFQIAPEVIEYISKRIHLLSTNPHNCVEIIYTVFNGLEIEGDFNWMIRQPQYKDCLFLYCEDEQHYFEHSFEKGAGTSGIRPWNMYGSPGDIHSAPILTGSYEKGYERIDKENETKIDTCFKEIRELLESGKYTHVCYSSTPDEGFLGVLGCMNFNVGMNVIEIIMDKIYKLKDIPLKV